MRYLFLLIIVIGLASCKKNKGITQKIEGSVTNRFSGKGINAVTVTLKARLIENGIYTSGFTVLGSTQTDANGNYSFSFDRTNAGLYVLSASHPDYYDQNDTINADQVNYNNPLRYNVKIPAKSAVQIHIVNVEPVDSTELFTYGYNGSDLPCDCCTKDHVVFVGPADTTFGCAVYGDRMFNYSYTIQADGKPIKQVKDSVFCPNGQTTQVNISY